MSNKQPDAILIAKITYKLIEEHKEALLAHSVDEVRTILSRPLHTHEISALNSVLTVLPQNMEEGSIWVAHPVNEHGVDESTTVYIVAHTPQRNSFLMIHGNKANLVNYTDFHPVHCLWTVKPTLGESTIHYGAHFMPGVDEEEKGESVDTPPQTESRTTSLFNTAFELIDSIKNDTDNTSDDDCYFEDCNLDNPPLDDSDYCDIDDAEEFKNAPLDYIYQAFDSLDDNRLEEINDMLSNIKNFKNQKGS